MGKKSSIKVCCGVLSLALIALDLWVCPEYLYADPNASGTSGETSVVAGGVAAARVAQSVFDFGKVSAGTVVSHEFMIANVGSSPLVISGVEPACGCTVAEKPAHPIPPGGSLGLKASFDTAGFSGEKIKTLKVFTNDPSQSYLALSFQGVVEADIEAEPSRLFWGTVTRSELEEKSIRFATAKGSNYSVLSASTKSPFLELQMEELKGGKKRLIVRLRKDLPIGLFRETITVNTSSPTLPVLNIPVFARVKGDIEVKPTDLSFGLLELPLLKEVELSSVIELPVGSEVEVLEATSDDRNIDVELKKIASQRYSVHVKLREGVVGTIRSAVKVVTNHPDPEQREIVIPVYAIVSKKGS